MPASSFLERCVKARLLQCGAYTLDLRFPRIMAVLNVTNDSFSGDGHIQLGCALRAAEQALEQGADILDIGGESSRPGSTPVPEQLELDRVLPVLEALRGCGVPLSVDTVKPRVMAEAVRAGADLVNDIAAFRSDGAIAAIRQSSAALCVMHMQGEPRTMQDAPGYTDVLQEVDSFLMGRVKTLVAAGVAKERIIIDPGFGFGKTLDHNLTLLKGLDCLSRSGLPVLVGMSRKSMLGLITGRPIDERLVAGSVAAFAALQKGARIVRTHDVAATRDVLRFWAALSDDHCHEAAAE